MPDRWDQEILDEQVPIPDSFLCPILQELMTDPMVAMDGHSYERAAIAEWFRTCGGNPRSPLTNQNLPSPFLKQNHALRKAIEAWKEVRPEICADKMELQDVRMAVEMHEYVQFYI